MVENARTIMERFGFKDPQLTTPEHDKILLWLNNNWMTVLKETGMFNKPDEICPMCRECSPCSWSRKYGKCVSPSPKNVEIAQKWSEDFYLVWSSIRDGTFLEKVKEKAKVQIEAPIMGSNNYNIGFVDFLVQIDNYSIENFNAHGWSKGTEFLVEIKPTVDSIGETIRQIQFYRSHRKGVYILVTKTTGLKELFAQQGIYVYEYKED